MGTQRIQFFPCANYIHLLYSHEIRKSGRGTCLSSGCICNAPRCESASHNYPFILVHCSVLVKTAVSARQCPSPPIQSEQRNSIWFFYSFLTITNKKNKVRLSASDAAAPAQLFHQHIQEMFKISRASSSYCNINARRGAAGGKFK